MKRGFGLIFVSFLLGLPLCTPGIAGDCTPHKINSLFSNSNEYLYKSVADYSSKVAYECQKDYCGDDDVVVVRDPHYLDRKKVDDAQLYRCQLGGDDKWVPTDLPACSNPDTDCNVPYASLDVTYGDNWAVSKSKRSGLPFETAHHKYSDLCTCTDEQLKHAFEQKCIKDASSKFDDAKKVCQDSGGKFECDKFEINNNNARCYIKVDYESGLCRVGVWSNACECPAGMYVGGDLQIQYPYCMPPTPGDTCGKKDLPQYATAGVWIASGAGGNPACAATACQNGTYLVVNASGVSQGWCTAPIQCSDGTTMRIIDGTKTDRTCVDSADLVWFADCINRGDLDCITQQLKNGADIKALGTFGGWTALAYAALNGKTDIVKYLVEKDADIEAKDPKGWTPLMLAAINRHMEVVKYLVEKGANIEAKNNDGKTILEKIETEEDADEYTDIVEYLRQQLQNKANAQKDNEKSGAPATSVPDTRNEDARANLTKHISDVAQKLKSISDGFGRSHWKTTDGNFNTARLASDSIAGVVLGTAGGLITSSVIKKNQVKGGFEDIKCAIGGQSVAGFGDDFIVGQQ